MLRQFCAQLYYGLYYLLKAIMNPNFHKFPLKGAYKGKEAFILVNGPSLNNVLREFDNGKVFLDNNAFMVNLGALDENHFFKIKPIHYCFSDPVFYRDYEPKKDAIRKMYCVLQEKVDWDMNIYMCFEHEWEFRQLINYSGITNPHIHFIKINKKLCDKLMPSLRNHLYSSGYFMPAEGSIATTAIYVALLEGYSTIKLYGADFTMFQDLAVNDSNQLCSLDRHFYDSKEPVLKPYLDTSRTDGKCFRVHDYFEFVYTAFKAQELLRQFADSLNVRIINCTKGSMIDSYERDTNILL